MRNYRTVSDRKLVTLIKKGDRQAFDEIYFRYIPRLQAFTRIYIKNDTVGEEALQEVFIKIWEKRGNLDENLSIKAFLFQSVKNQLFNIFRQKTRELNLEEHHTSFEKLAKNTIEEQWDFIELQEQTFKIIDELPEVQKRIFKMSRIDGLNNEEISKTLNLSRRTVEHHIYLALKTLKRKLTLAGAAVSFLLFIQFVLG